MNDLSSRFSFQNITYVIVLKVTKIGEDQLKRFWDAQQKPSGGGVKRVEMCVCILWLYITFRIMMTKSFWLKAMQNVQNSTRENFCS